MSLPKAMSTWTTDPRGTAQANLSSVAPWLYGGITSTVPHDTMDAGAAPPELSYPGPVGAFADDLHHHHHHHHHHGHSAAAPHHHHHHHHQHHNGPAAGDYGDLNAQLPTVEEVFGGAAKHPLTSSSAAPPLPPSTTATTAGASSSTSAATATAAAAAAAAINFTSPGPFGNVPLMSLEDAEQALVAARKETEKLEKSLAQLMRKNRRLLMAGGGGNNMPSAASMAMSAAVVGGDGTGGGGGH
jgi:CCR4-NOT transcription complex subunit 4